MSDSPRLHGRRIADHALSSMQGKYLPCVAFHINRIALIVFPEYLQKYCRAKFATLIASESQFGVESREEGGGNYRIS